MTIKQGNKTHLEFIKDELRVLKDAGLYRKSIVIEDCQGPYVTIDGEKYLSFCSNDYLGLAGHPKVKEAAREAIARYGWGAGASRLVSGTNMLHERLETEIARFKSTEAALVFPTGYMANLGAVCALMGKGDLILCDRLNHASIIDASRQSGAAIRVYAHNDVTALDRVLRRVSNNYEKMLIVTDGVFSVDGDIAPIPEIVSTAKRFGPGPVGALRAKRRYRYTDGYVEQGYGRYWRLRGRHQGTGGLSKEQVQAVYLHDRHSPGRLCGRT